MRGFQLDNNNCGTRLARPNCFKGRSVNLYSHAHWICNPFAKCYANRWGISYEMPWGSFLSWT